MWVIQLGVAPIRIDILSEVTGLADFESAWKNRVDGRFGSASTHYMGLDSPSPPRDGRKLDPRRPNALLALVAEVVRRDAPGHAVQLLQVAERKRGLPIVLMPQRGRAVEHRLHRDIGHGLDLIGCRRAKRPQRLDKLFPFADRAADRHRGHGVALNRPAIVESSSGQPAENSR